MSLPFEGCYCNVKVRDYAGLPVIVDPEAPDGGPFPVALTRRDWNALGELYRRS
jgi:hypothetical protein